jgi:oxygen-dependent protoporphyrinogen oxidase
MADVHSSPPTVRPALDGGGAGPSDAPVRDALVARQVAVVGGGVSGLTAAFRLRQAGLQVTVFEAARVPGGRTMTIRRDGYAFDVGAITMLPTYVQTFALLDELGLGADLDLAHPIRSLLATRLLSTATKLRMLGLVPTMHRVWPLAGFATMAPLAAWDNESVADFCRRVLGEEAHEYVAGPVMRGNTLNDTACAPAAELLWMLRQYAAARITGLDTGINGLAEALADGADVEYGTRITRIERVDGGVGVSGENARGVFSRRFGACVVALPAPDLLALAPPMAADQRGFLQTVRSLPSVNVHLGLRRAPPLRQTFVLPPRSEQRDLTTIVLDHLKAPGRAPAGHGVVSLFLRDDWSARHMDDDDAQVLAEVLAMARPFVGDLRPDVESFVVQRWRHANVKSHVGLYRGMSGYEAALDAESPVQLAGDFLSQGIESAVISGQAAAARIVARQSVRSPA